jgi:hypothetical protein
VLAKAIGAEIININDISTDAAILIGFFMGSPLSEVPDKNIIPFIHKISFDFACLEPYDFGLRIYQHSSFFGYATSFLVFANGDAHFHGDEMVLRF